MSSDPSPHSAPRAPQRPVTSTLHGEQRIDPYAWLRNREDPEVISHLEAENAYTADTLAPLAGLRESIFLEMKARIQETDLSLPTRKGTWSYYSRTVEGKSYPIHCRRPTTSVENDPDATADEEVLLDQNLLAEGHVYFSLGTFEVTVDHRLLAYGVDTAGDEIYELRFRDLTTGVDLADVVAETSAGVAWSADGSSVLYLVLDDAMRPYQVWRHRMGSSNDDELVYEETDDRFYCGVSMSATDEYIFLVIGSQVTTETRVARADELDAGFVMFREREQGREYAIDHHRGTNGADRFFVVTNDGAENFRLCTAAGPGSPWIPFAPEWDTDDELAQRGDDVDRRPKVEGIEVFRRHVALHERVEGLERLRVLALGDDGSWAGERTVAHDEPVHSVWPVSNADVDAPFLRFGYSSLTTPPSVFDFDLTTGERVLRKRQPVLGDFDPTRYVTERRLVAATDGTRVPMSIVRHRDTPIDGTAPGLLYGYGSYEISSDPTFSTMRLSLLDRGFVFAIAHVRGGGELGRRWYLDGKFLAKKNTFTDFVACARSLTAEGDVAPGRLVSWGGSAGGLLVGASMNLAPDVFAGVIAEVPFVDVVNTMLDESLPLTAIEWEEWGNPADPEYYAYMQSYAPYENVHAAPYPAVLATAGLNDPRVGFWEPAKWVQRLRAVTTGDRPILLKTELGAGHGGPSGRYDAWRDTAFVMAFACWCVGAA